MVMGPITDMELNLNSKLHERTILVPIVCLNNLLLSRVKIQSTNISKYIDMAWTFFVFIDAFSMLPFKNPMSSEMRLAEAANKIQL